ncbi:TolC family protein, partial [Acinetobacter baumannii]
VKAARASRSPQVSLTAGSSYYNYLGSLSQEARTLGGQNPNGISNTIGAQLTLPVFQGGLPAAQVRQAQARRASALETVTLTERGVIAQ